MLTPRTRAQAASQNLSGGMGPYFPNTSQPQGWGSGLAPQGLAEAGAAWGALQGTQAALRAHQAGFSGLLPSDPLGPGGAQVNPATVTARTSVAKPASVRVPGTMRQTC